jgi:GT2 family glycosyltransferase
MGGESRTARPAPLNRQDAGSGLQASVPAPAVPDGFVAADASVSDRASTPGTGIMAVLVLYRCAPQDSACWKSLEAQVGALPEELRFQVLFCENEAGAGSAPQLPGWVEYLPRTENAGLAWAYNAGLARAQAFGAEWLLTLDQDTDLPIDFLRQIFARAAALYERKDIAAIVPELMSAGGEVYSPFLSRPGYESALPAGFKGVARGDVRAFNSGALVRVAWLKRNGGYDPLFWLDFLDHALFRAIGRSGARVWIAGDIRVEHRLSVTEDRSSMSEARFQNFLEAEAASLDLYGTRTEGLLHTLRLIVRVVNQRRRKDPEGFTKQTRKLLSQRLRLSRQTRITQWREKLQREKPWTLASPQDDLRIAEPVSR